MSKKRKHPRRRRHSASNTGWQEFVSYLNEVYVRRDERGIFNLSALRGFLYEHPVIGLQHRRQYWPNLRRHVVRDGTDPAEIVSNQVLLPQRLRDATPGSSRIRLQRFIDLWQPGGPLRITMEEINAIEEFQKWRENRK